jgi:hypothetical protein
MLAPDHVDHFLSQRACGLSGQRQGLDDPRIYLYAFGNKSDEGWTHRFRQFLGWCSVYNRFPPSGTDSVN